MDIILLERVEKLGAIGDVVKVKDGFARNFLLPQQEGAARQRSQQEGLRGKPRPDRIRQRQSPRRGREGSEELREGLGHDHPPGIERRPAVRLGRGARHRRGADRRRPQGAEVAGRARQADQDDRPAHGQDRASPGSFGQCRRQRRAFARRGRDAGARASMSWRRCSRKAATRAASPRTMIPMPSPARPRRFPATHRPVTSRRRAKPHAASAKTKGPPGMPGGPFAIGLVGWLLDCGRADHRGQRDQREEQRQKVFHDRLSCTTDVLPQECADTRRGSRKLTNINAARRGRSSMKRAVASRRSSGLADRLRSRCQRITR